MMVDLVNDANVLANIGFVTLAVVASMFAFGVVLTFIGIISASTCGKRLRRRKRNTSNKNSSRVDRVSRNEASGHASDNDSDTTLPPGRGVPHDLEANRTGGEWTELRPMGPSAYHRGHEDGSGPRRG
ncbi:hypothetical protein NOR_02853 [Metarhizium rileyi]|uniref:Uncharacterized protein n=1 Tax=Metarhizium rileyi (strain RCEF 4871) TaxID=1649241 RepID=A0A162LWR2_METRR|nr:hypothetical protein NOR_02853 [Metarhizium rileyi RCEF 4871]TWU79093.1 hypothetical protein ED733_008705 [Metarhizium rileyi]